MEQSNTLKYLLWLVKQNHPDANFDKIKEAYHFAEKAHGSELRKSGEPYINHPLGAAITLAEMKMNDEIIVAGLLHDVPEDTMVTLEEIEKIFGNDITSIIEGVTKIGHLKYRGMERYAENLRKMFFAIAKDPRVVIVRFADRLYNLKTLYSLPREKQLRIATETLDIYAPIAGRLGIAEMKERLEDEAFRYALPEEYIWTRNLVIDKYFEKNQLVGRETKVIERELKKQNIPFVAIRGRAKRLYSLYKKLLKYDRDIEKIYDLVALRVIVKTISECYAVLGIIHTIWTPLKGRIKDYISQPKPNGYRSLHTTVFTKAGDILEIQIRTEEMHVEAEYGLAAHWQYKSVSELPSKRLKWMKDIVLWQKQFNDHETYLENLKNMKLDVLQDRIFVFTPSGDVIELPEEATPIDFAYLIHSDIGNKCCGAKINGKLSSLDSALKNGDMVEIATDKNRKGPSQDWLQFVKTQMARSRIRAYTNKVKRKMAEG
jgi:GTP pyrophosphokinase